MPAVAPRLVGSLVTLLIAILALAGCGKDNNKSSTKSTSSTSKIAQSVPAAIKNKGTITVAADASYAPNEFIEGGKVVGMTPDLANALGGVLGLQVRVVNATFDAILPGLASGKYDLGISSFTDTKEREKTVDFVTYYSAGTSFYVTANGGPDIGSLNDLCGHKVAVERGTTQAADVNAQQKKCGSNKVDLLVFPDQNGANLAIKSGRAEIGMADSPVAAYIVKQSNGAFKLSGQPYGTAPYGIAIPKNNGMAQPVLDALKELISNGKYLEVLKKWGIEQGAIDNPVINGAQS